MDEDSLTLIFSPSTALQQSKIQSNKHWIKIHENIKYSQITQDKWVQKHAESHYLLITNLLLNDSNNEQKSSKIKHKDTH